MKKNKNGNCQIGEVTQKIELHRCIPWQEWMFLLRLMKRLAIGFSLSIFLIVKGHAQDSLGYYLELAAQNNPAIKASYLEYSAALQKVPQAASLPDPQLQLGYFLKPMELLGGNQIANIQLMQMFPWFGTLRAAKDEASKMAIARFENFRNTRNELFFQVKAAFYKIYQTKKEIAVAEKNLKILKTLEQLALIKFGRGSVGSAGSSGSAMSSPVASVSAGNTTGMNSNSMGSQVTMGSSSMSVASTTLPMQSAESMGSSMNAANKGGLVDLLRVQIEINTLENQIALLRDQLTTDKVSFNRLLNRPPQTDVFTGDTLIETPVPDNLLSLSDSLVNHPMVRMQEAEAQANDAKLIMVTRMGYPMIGAGVNYMLIQPRENNTSMMNGKDMIMPMVSITLPIYRKKYKAMQQEAIMLREAAIARARETLNNLQLSFQQSLQNLYDASRRINLYKKQAQLADKSVQLLITSFSVSGADFEEVLRMQQQLLDYEFRLIEAVVDKNMATASLIYLTGIE